MDDNFDKYPKLRTCPRCGAEAHWERPSSWDDDIWIMCAKCDHGVDIRYFDSVKEAAKWWNHRPLEDQFLSRIEKLETAITELQNQIDVLESDMHPRISEDGWRED